MKKILWFCRTNDSSSLSRITDSIIPLIKKKFEITLLSNKTNIQGINNVIIGSDTKSIKYIDFINQIPGAFNNGKIDQNNIRSINMKYIMVQIVDLIYEGDYDYLLICNGIYEIDKITKILSSNQNYLINKKFKKTKLIIWAPIDYIPSYKVIENISNADKFITMTPTMQEEISKLIPNSTCELHWVGHGSDICNDSYLSREELVYKLNNMRKSKLIMSKVPFDINDIIILNANNYGPLDINLKSVENTPGTRKRLDITIKAFLKILEKNKKVKLWIHTNLKSFFEMLAIEKILLSNFIDNIILSNNNLNNNELILIYQMCNISLQTSTGEGWSLTNLEASLYRSLQVVPDFLACGYHFKNRGILIPITKKIIKNEGNMDVIIGEVSIADTVDKLNEALELLNDTKNLNIILDNAYKYSKEYTWLSVSNKLTDILNN